MADDTGGVVDYPIAQGMNLTGIWKYVPNSNGPSITAGQGSLLVRRGMANLDNQSTFLSIQQDISTQGGVALQFDLTIDSIELVQDVLQLTLAMDLILMYQYSVFRYCTYYNQQYHTWAYSGIKIGDGQKHTVILFFSDSGVAIFEDGIFLGKWPTTMPATFNPHFDWQIQSRGSSLTASISNIFIIPNLFAPGVNTPWDVTFQVSNTPASTVWSVAPQPGNPITATYGESWMRLSTTNLKIRNSNIATQLAIPMGSYGIVMYRMRVNVSGGSESKVSILGDNILRIVNGSSLAWYSYGTNQQFTKLSDTSIRVGGDWITVTVVYEPKTVTLFENNVYRYTRTYASPTQNWTATFHVGHLDVGTAVSVDLSNFRALPLNKTNDMLALDLAPSVLFYYPLKEDLSEAIIQDPLLDLVPTGGFTPNYQPGLFGPAMNFKGSQGALKTPTLPYGRSFPSYTVSLWTFINNYPSSQNTGLVGPLSLQPDGKLSFVFLYSGNTGPYMSTPFTSRLALPRSQWVSIILTYAYEESRLVIYLNGQLDSAFYTSPDNLSRAAIIPINGIIGAQAVGNSNKFLPLDGLIGDIQAFEQHVHPSSAAALASKQGSVLQGAARHSKEAVLLLPAPLLIAWAVLSIGAVQTWYNSKTSNKLTSKQVADKIVAKVGSPAKPGVKISRADIGVPDDFPIVLHVYGEGASNSLLAIGIKEAINVNDHDSRVDYIDGTPSNIAIPNLVKIAPWNTDPDLPFANGFADRIVCFSQILTQKLALQIGNIIKPNTGIIEIWTPWQPAELLPPPAFLVNLQAIATQVARPLEQPPQLDRFKNNGDEWYQRWRIKA